MIFWIVIFTTIIVTIATVIISKIFDYMDGLIIIGGSFSTILWIVSIIITICVVANNVNAIGKKEGYQKQYETLSYQINNNLYDNDNDYGKKELYNQVLSWNRDLAYRKQAQKDFWIGIFYPNIYDDLEYIELP